MFYFGWFLLVDVIHELLKDHPFYSQFKTYLPDYRFLFKDITQEPQEKILAIQNQFSRRALFAMANRHRPDLLFKQISVIFEEDHEDRRILLATYFLR